MKKKIYIYILIFIVISFSILIFIFSFKIASGKNENNIKISLMYTNKDYIANYGIYDLKKNDFKKVYSRKNECFSDFSIDQKHNILYYSNLIEKKYNIYKVDLTNKKDNTIDLYLKLTHILQVNLTHQ
ncbi:hypothetical protein, partial [Clostridium sp. C8-1-8]|uniref:hypothetical protein n=1 Tax=Clostridium sp. C8-1-8 TaxID=2698831 RepID=UPI001371F2EE